MLQPSVRDITPASTHSSTQTETTSSPTYRHSTGKGSTSVFLIQTVSVLPSACTVVTKVFTLVTDECPAELCTAIIDI